MVGKSFNQLLPMRRTIAWLCNRRMAIVGIDKSGTIGCHARQKVYLARVEACMASEKPTFWIYAKSYGWGWEFPATRQGWLTYVPFIALIFASKYLAATPKVRLAFIIASTIALILVAAVKGERPLRWRWGRDQATNNSQFATPRTYSASNVSVRIL